MGFRFIWLPSDKLAEAGSSGSNLLTFQTTSVTPATFDPSITLSGGAPTPEWDLGDGNTDNTTSVSHVYASAGTKTVTLNPLALAGYITVFDVNTDNVTTLDVSALTNLTQLFCYSNSISVLDVSALTNLTQLRCDINNISVLDVSALTNLILLYCHINNISVLDVSALNVIRSIQCQSNGMSQGNVDSIIDGIYSNRANYTYATPSLSIGGSNAAPSGVYQYSATPSTGKEKIYALVNDDDLEGFNTWTITYTA